MVGSALAVFLFVRHEAGQQGEMERVIRHDSPERKGFVDYDYDDDMENVNVK